MEKLILSLAASLVLATNALTTVWGQDRPINSTRPSRRFSIVIAARGATSMSPRATGACCTT